MSNWNSTHDTYLIAATNKISHPSNFVILKYLETQNFTFFTAKVPSKMF
jgi:hypothetical protein